MAQGVVHLYSRWRRDWRGDDSAAGGAVGGQGGRLQRLGACDGGGDRWNCKGHEERSAEVAEAVVRQEWALGPTPYAPQRPTPYALRPTPYA